MENASQTIALTNFPSQQIITLPLSKKKYGLLRGKELLIIDIEAMYSFRPCLATVVHEPNCYHSNGSIVFVSDEPHVSMKRIFVCKYKNYQSKMNQDPL